MKVNNQYDFFKTVRLDENGNMITSDGKNITEKLEETSLNTMDTKDAIVFLSNQLEDVKNLLKLILS
jgi:predicted NACHT family NTPase